MIGVFFVCLAGVICGVGIMMLLPELGPREEGRRKFIRHLGKTLKKRLVLNSGDNIVKGTHYYISINRYDNIRFSVGAGTILLGAMIGNGTLPLLSAAFLIFSWPRESFRSIKLPFFYFCQILLKLDHEKKDIELMELLSLLKNIMVQMKNNPLGADYIIEYITYNTELTKSAFMKLLNQMRLNRYQEAEEQFCNEIGTALAKDVARILIQLDSLNPADLEEILVSVQRQIREMKITKKKTQTELIGDLTLIPVLITTMLIFLNLISIIADIKQMDMLTNFF